jgi:chromosome segregation ATPase
MEDKKSYLKRMADQLSKWDAEINELKRKAHKAKTDSGNDLQKQINELHAKKKTVQNKYKQLQETGDETWNQLKTGFEKSWTELKVTFANTAAKFNNN